MIPFLILKVLKRATRPPGLLGNCWAILVYPCDVAKSMGVIPSLACAFLLAPFSTKQQEIIDWLKVCDPFENHVAARKRHKPRTGNWFISTTEFIRWRDGHIHSLWL